MAHRVVIIGGGFGGLHAAQSLHHPEIELTLLDKRNFHLFQPLLYQVATGALSPGNIASPLRWILRNQKNTHVLLAEVTDVDLSRRTVHIMDGFPILYDTLIVAAGAQNNYFGHPEWEANAPGLKSVEDAMQMRRKILNAFEMAERQLDPARRKAWLTFVVVGAGPTGVELAGSVGEIAQDIVHSEFRRISKESIQILLIDIVDRTLPTFNERLSAKAEDALHHLGVTFLKQTSVTQVGPETITVQSAGHSQVLPTHTVLWTAGVRPVPLTNRIASQAQVTLSKRGRLPVGKDLTLPQYSEVYVVGDMGEVSDTEGKPLPGIAPVAIQQGRYVADAILRKLQGQTIPDFRYRHQGDMATIGRAAAVADWGGFRLNGFLAWLTWLFIHLWFLVEFENRFLVFTQWAWNYFTRNRSARLITGDNNLR